MSVRSQTNDLGSAGHMSIHEAKVCSSQLFEWFEICTESSKKTF